MGKDTLKIGDRFIVAMHWRLDVESDVRVWASFAVEILELDPDDMRYLCRFIELVSLRTSNLPERVNPALLTRIRELPGLYAYLPFEAAAGRTLFLKPGTLTGRHNYFFDENSDKFPVHLKT